MGLESTGSAHWEGDLANGTGTVALETGAAPVMSVTWKARSEDHGGLTSPEELIAAAHASCFSMALAGSLTRAGHPPASLDTSATATFVVGEGITTMVLTVVGDVPGMSEEDFLAAAEGAKENCPVSKALKGNVEVSLEASLA
ncbi:MAG TPA: OsmC family peroxiredoxin [Acidimicrobiia bacterium]